MEVFHNSIWGTVCDDDWDIKDATVVCRQLGSLNAVSAPRSARFGAGSGQIWLDNVGCSGSESSIENCPHNGWGIQNCDHGEDASVICSSKLCRPGLFKGHFVRLLMFYYLKKHCREKRKKTLNQECKIIWVFKYICK